jgi:hypothetical protein
MKLVVTQNKWHCSNSTVAVISIIVLTKPRLIVMSIAGGTSSLRPTFVAVAACELKVVCLNK